MQYVNLVIRFHIGTNQAVSGTYDGGDIEGYNYIHNGMWTKLPDHICKLIDFLNEQSLNKI